MWGLSSKRKEALILQNSKKDSLLELRVGKKWKERLLNKEGKGILIRGVIPAHNMTFASKFQRKFSIKSVYHVQKLDLPSLALRDSSSSSGVSTTIWKSLWNAPFMPKVENFLRRTLHNNLAVRENLLKK